MCSYWIVVKHVSTTNLSLHFPNWVLRRIYTAGCQFRLVRSGQAEILPSGAPLSTVVVYKVSISTNYMVRQRLLVISSAFICFSSSQELASNKCSSFNATGSLSSKAKFHRVSDIVLPLASLTSPSHCASPLPVNLWSVTFYLNHKNFIILLLPPMCWTTLGVMAHLRPVSSGLSSPSFSARVSTKPIRFSSYQVVNL